MNFNKYFALVCGGALMMSASCSNEIEFQQAEQTVTFSVKMPGNTRAASQLGTGTAANTLHCYAYDANNKLVAEAEGTMANKSGDVTITLASKVAYKLVFWADKAQEADKTLYAFDKENHKVTVNYANMSAQSEDNDAFYNVIDYTGGETTQTVSLTRPLAQINVGTDDSALTVVTTAYNSNVYSNCVIKADSELDLLTGATATPVTLTAPITPMSDLATEDFPVAGASNVKYTGVYYVLAPSTGSTVDMTFNAYKSATDATPCWSVPVPNMPVRRNFRTNVFGSLLTSLTNFSVTITPTFDGETQVKEVTTAAQLKQALTETTQDVAIKLAGNFENEVVSIPAAATTRTITIDLAGKNAPALAAGENVILNIYDNSDLTGATRSTRSTRSTRATVTNEDPCFHAKPGSTINIYGGNYLASVDSNGDSNSCVYSSGGAVNIYGGTFACQKAYNGKWYVLNLKNGSTGTITVYGGRFKDQNPADGDDANTPGITIATGMISTLTDGWYTITDTSWSGGMSQPEIVGNVYKIRTGDELAWYSKYTETHSSRGHVVEIQNDIDLCNLNWTPIAFNNNQDNGFCGTFNGNGHTIKNLNINAYAGTWIGFISHSCWDDPKCNVEIKNVVFDGVKVNVPTMAEYTGCVVGKGKTPIRNVTVKNATIKGYQRLGGIIGECYTTVENCTVDGLTIKANFFMKLDSNNVPSMDGANGVGGIVGFGPGATITGCSVNNANFTVYRRGGSIVGYGGTDGKLVVRNNTASNVVMTYNYNDAQAYKGDTSNYFNTFCGDAGSHEQSGNTATNVTIPDNTSGKAREGF